jgi:hypothetical protein
MGIVYSNGSQEVSVPSGQKIAIYSDGKADIYYKQIPGNIPSVFYYASSIESEEVLLGTFSNVDTVRIDAYASDVIYEVGASPTIALVIPGLPSIRQGAPTAKTVSATLTAAEVLAGIITVNQAAAGASAQQLPLATAIDTALPTFVAGDAFDFSVINISTVDAEDASVTTNTGWTLVGNMDIHAYSAAGSLNSSALFRARKTGTAAWTLYRLA